MSKIFTHKTIIYYLLGSMYLAGIAGLFFEESRKLFQLFTPFHILSVAIFMFSNVIFSNKTWAYIFIISLSGYLVEVLGVYTGLIFGKYQYETTLGFKVLEVPLLIGVNWLIMVYTSTVFIRKFIDNKILISILSGLLIAVIDYIIEPVAIKLDMWSWAEGTPPIQNYIAWFIIGTIMTFISQNLLDKKPNLRAEFILLCQILFFGVLFIGFSL